MVANHHAFVWKYFAIDLKEIDLSSIQTVLLPKSIIWTLSAKGSLFSYLLFVSIGCVPWPPIYRDTVVLFVRFLSPSARRKLPSGRSVDRVVGS